MCWQRLFLLRRKITEVPAVPPCFRVPINNKAHNKIFRKNIPILRDGVEALRNSSIAIDGEKIQAERDADALSALIEGMEVSVDVSTCDADAGRPYFGTVTEISELDGAKNGCILLVQIAEPNFKPTGNSPAIPDGYALVPVELTGAMTNALTDAILDDLHYVDVWRSVLAGAPQQESK